MPGIVSTIWRMYGMQSRIKKVTSIIDYEIAFQREPT